MGSLIPKVMSRVTLNTVGAPDESTSPPTFTILKLWMSWMVDAARASTVLTASSIEPDALPESLMVLVMEDISLASLAVLGTWYLDSTSPGDPRVDGPGSVVVRVVRGVGNGENQFDHVDGTLLPLKVADDRVALVNQIPDFRL